MKQVLLTGDRPTGALHLGHLVGSLDNRVKLQSEFETYILIADIQALTDNFMNPLKVKQNVFELMADYLAVGINPIEASTCLQSAIPELFELTQYLSNLMPFDQLKHNPTLKKELEQKNINNLSFISYPVSQAADILGFKSSVIPVGEDQKPIIELTNKLAQKFNQTYKVEMLQKVKALYGSHGRLKGIDGDNKMSKSLNNAIFLKDSMDEIKKKVYKMYTDPLHVRVEEPGHIEGNVVIYYLDIFDPNQKELEQLKENYQKGGVADIVLKNRLVDILEAKLSPIRLRRQALSQDESYLKEQLKIGTYKAREKVSQTVKEVREILTIQL